MDKKITISTDNDELYNANQAVKEFTESHSKNLSDDERIELGELLDKRAKALSDVLGVKVGSVTGNS